MNSFAPIDPSLIDVVLPPSGYPDELAAGDTRDALWDVCGDASRVFPQALWIEPSEWEDAARDVDKYKTWPVNFCDRFTHQGNSHECTAHSLSRNFEIARNYARGIIYPEGPKKDFRYEESSTSGSVWVSPLSIYAEANPQQWGGASIRQVMDIAIRRGFLPDKIQPADYGFKHALHATAGGTGGKNHSDGPWVPLSRFPEGHQETSKHLRILEVIFPETAEQAMCLVLNSRAVCVGRSGHAIPYALANIREKLLGYVDSYNVIRWDSWSTVRRAVSGAYSIASVTAPSDWNKPAE